jgi:hypothetical protein
LRLQALTTATGALRWSRLGLGLCLPTASAVAVSIAVVPTAWFGAALSAALTLNSTTAAALGARGLSTTTLTTATLMSAASTATRPRFTTRRSLPLSAFCRDQEGSRRDDHDRCDEERFDAHTC